MGDASVNQAYTGLMANVVNASMLLLIIIISKFVLPVLNFFILFIGNANVIKIL